MSKHTQEILNLVNLRGSVSVKELCQILGVSDQTVRRLVRPMAEYGEVKKVHGAIISTNSPADPPFSARMNLHRPAKVAIAKHIAGFIRDGDSLAIDTGSTSGFVAQALQARRSLTVVTNSAFVASTLAMIEGNRVFMAGTQLRNHDGASFDRSAFAVIERMHTDYVVLSASMVDPENGFLVHEQCEVEIAITMQKIAQRTIMAVDHSKFEQLARMPCLKQPSLRPGDILVTDKQPGTEFNSLLSELEVRIADVLPASSRTQRIGSAGIKGR